MRSTRRPRHTLCVIPLDQAINARQAQRSVALLKARAVVVTGDAMALELAEPERYPVAAVRHDVVRDDSGGDQPALETFGAQRLGAKLMEAPFLPDIEPYQRSGGWLDQSQLVRRAGAREGFTLLVGPLRSPRRSL